ncbi:proline-rich protein 13-like isoform X4 [Panicum virgatum]|uniref:proline-rich protein 13-like isoform X4 n=1 Tax=Panicum virgatum TaxID=38727 RepID=UPI0019D63958|nr:proline-rich protein 13-like isoform X4 [Panicum virgatum]
MSRKGELPGGGTAICGGGGGPVKARGGGTEKGRSGGLVKVRGASTTTGDGGGGGGDTSPAAAPPPAAAPLPAASSPAAPPPCWPGYAASTAPPPNSSPHGNQCSNPWGGYLNMLKQPYFPPLQPFGENSHYVGAANTFQPPSPAHLNHIPMKGPALTLMKKMVLRQVGKCLVEYF